MIMSQLGPSRSAQQVTQKTIQLQIHKVNGQTLGYTASYSNEAGTYSEILSSFDDTTVFHFYGPSVQVYRTSSAGSKNGLVIAGKGEWTFDENHPILRAMAYELGTELTEGSCADKYAEVWAANNDVQSSPFTTRIKQSW